MRIEERTELNTGGVHPRTWSGRVGPGRVTGQMYAIFADRVGSRIGPNFPKFVVKIWDQLMYGWSAAEASLPTRLQVI